jgi:hypothetical protein
MSLSLDVDHVTKVLLSDGWHNVHDKSFTLDSYEYIWFPNQEKRDRGEPMIMHAGGRSGVCATGFQMRCEHGEVAGPLTSILAVRMAAAR